MIFHSLLVPVSVYNKITNLPPIYIFLSSLQKPKFCESTSFQLLDGNKVCHDYQEMKIQESTQVLGVGAIPRSIPVILQDDLVDIVKAGGIM